MFNKFPYTDFHELNADWIINTIKQLIADWDSLKGDFNNLKEYVDSQISDDHIRYIVNYMIDKYMSSGKLDELIKGNNLLEVADYYPVYQHYTRVESYDAMAPGAQGFCIANRNGVPYIFCGMSASDGSVSTGSIAMYRMDSDSPITEHMSNDLGHLNDMCYYPKDDAIICVGHGYSDRYYCKYDISSDMLVKVEYDIPGLESITGISYDNINDVFYCRGKYEGYHRIFTLNSALNSIINYSAPISYEYDHHASQGLTYYGGKIYLVDGRTLQENYNKSAIGMINIYSAADLTYLTSVYVPSVTELEGVDTINGKWYFYFTTGKCGLICEGDISHSNATYGALAGFYGRCNAMRNTTTATMYIGTNSCKFKCDGSATYPYYRYSFYTALMSSNIRYLSLKLVDDMDIEFTFYKSAFSVPKVVIDLNGKVLNTVITTDCDSLLIKNGTLSWNKAKHPDTLIISSNELTLEDVYITGIGNANEKPIQCYANISLKNVSCNIEPTYLIDGNYKTIIRNRNSAKWLGYNSSYNNEDAEIGVVPLNGSATVNYSILKFPHIGLRGVITGYNSNITNNTKIISLTLPEGFELPKVTRYSPFILIRITTSNNEYINSCCQVVSHNNNTLDITYLGSTIENVSQIRFAIDTDMVMY